VNDTYDEFSELLGAYALDAVDPDERERIERHLADCPRCRAEVSEHREVASYLSHTGATAPEGVWDRISAELAPAAPPMRMAIVAPEPDGPAASEADGRSASEADGGSASEAPVVPIEAAKRRGSRPMLAILAIAACIVALLGVVAVGQARRLNQGQSVEEMASRAASDSKLKVELTGDDGSAKAVVGADGQGYLIMDGVPAPAEGDVYQLWGKVDGTILSLGTFGDRSVVPFSLDPDRIGDIELFAVTQEKAPGVVASDQVPIMAGTV
jgi:hypothetical protein